MTHTHLRRYLLLITFILHGCGGSGGTQVNTTPIPSTDNGDVIANLEQAPIFEGSMIGYEGDVNAIANTNCRNAGLEVIDHRSDGFYSVEGTINENDQSPQNPLFYGFPNARFGNLNNDPESCDDIIIIDQGSVYIYINDYDEGFLSLPIRIDEFNGNNAHEFFYNNYISSFYNTYRGVDVLVMDIVGDKAADIILYGYIGHDIHFRLIEMRENGERANVTRNVQDFTVNNVLGELYDEGFSNNPLTQVVFGNFVTNNSLDMLLLVPAVGGAFETTLISIGSSANSNHFDGNADQTIYEPFLINIPGDGPEKVAFNVAFNIGNDPRDDLVLITNDIEYAGTITSERDIYVVYPEDMPPLQ